RVHDRLPLVKLVDPHAVTSAADGFSLQRIDKTELCIFEQCRVLWIAGHPVVVLLPRHFVKLGSLRDPTHLGDYLEECHLLRLAGQLDCLRGLPSCGRLVGLCPALRRGILCKCMFRHVSAFWHPCIASAICQKPFTTGLHHSSSILSFSTGNTGLVRVGKSPLSSRPRPLLGLYAFVHICRLRVADCP